MTPSIPMHGKFVAQVSNLLYRRLPAGRPGASRTPGGLESRDTADWKSALRGSWSPFWAALALAGALLVPGFLSAQEKPEQKAPPPAKRTPIPIAKVARKSAVDFERDILPILKSNCLACHNQTKAKAKLILESPADMLKGGDSGPAIIPKRGSSSLLVKTAAHQVEDTVMPPPKNNVRASDLTPEQLGLLKLWIDQGAKASVHVAARIDWQPLPPGLYPIYAVALSPDGQFAACGRANQIFVYHLPARRLVTRLTDPQLLKAGLYGKPGAAHRDMVYSLAFSPDGNLLASGSHREVKLWRRPHGEHQFDLATSSRKSVRALAASPDGRWLATAEDDGAIKLWDAAKGKAATRITGHAGPISSLRFSPDNRLLLAGSADKTIRIWTVPEGRNYAEAETLAPVTAVTWLAGGRQLASAGDDATIRVWWLLPAGDQGELIGVRDLRGHEGPITSLDALPPAGVQLISGSGDGTVRQWNSETGQLIRQLSHGGPVMAVAVRGDGKRFAAAGLNNVARLWEPEKGAQIAELRSEKRAREQVEYLLRTVAATTNDIIYRKSVIQNATNQVNSETARLKKATEAAAAAAKSLAEKNETRRKAAEAKLAAEKELADLNLKVKAATDAFQAADNAAKQAQAAVKEAQGKAAQNKTAIDKLSADSTTKAKLAADAKTALDKASAETKDKLKQATDKVNAAAKPLADAEAQVKKAELEKSNADTESQLATKAFEQASNALTTAQAAHQSAEAHRKKVEGELLAARKAATEAESPIRTLAFAPDNQILATSGNDHLIHTWSAEDGTPLDTIDAGRGTIMALAFPVDEKLAAATSGQTTAIWNLNGGWKLERTLGTSSTSSPLVDRVNALAFSPDGQSLATGGGEPTRAGEIKLWEAGTGRLIRDYPRVHSDAVLGLDFSFDGKYLASGGADKFARVIEVATGNTVKSFEGHTSHVLGVSWKRDGRTLITSGADNVIKVWDVLTGDRKLNIAGFDKQVTSITFIGDSNQALATGGDAKVRLVDETGKEIRALAGAKDYVFAGAVTDDGRIVIAGGQDSVLRVWNGLNGQPLANFEPPPDK